MTLAPNDNAFTEAIPDLYDRYFVPMIFAPYAADLATRVAATTPHRVLELAAGTGAVTRAMASALPADASIVATDLNQAMLDRAAAVGTARPVEWRQADAMQLPFADASFDVVVCQFGAMFFPDKPRAFAEARRVLRPGGHFLFNVWDRMEENEFALVIDQALARTFADDPPTFMRRIPHGYWDIDLIARDLAAGGFAKAPVVTSIAARSRAPSAANAAFTYCQGTPWRGEIESRSALRLVEATNAAAEALARGFGRGAIEGKIQAHVVTVTA